MALTGPNEQSNFQNPVNHWSFIAAAFRAFMVRRTLFIDSRISEIENQYLEFPLDDSNGNNQTFQPLKSQR